MKKILINGFGKSFDSRTISIQSYQDELFLWKHNFKNIEKKEIKIKLKILKSSSEKSKSAKMFFSLYKKNIYFEILYFRKLLSSLEKKLIKNSELKIISKDSLPSRCFSNDKNNILFTKIIELESKFIKNGSIELNKMISKILKIKKFNKKHIIESEKKKYEVRTDFNNFIKSFKRSVGKIIKDFVIDKSKNDYLTRENVKNIRKNKNKINYIKIFKNSLSKKKEITANLNLTLRDKIIYFPFKNIYLHEYYTEKRKFYEDNKNLNIKKDSYQNEYDFKKANIHIYNDHKILNIKIESLNKISNQRNIIKNINNKKNIKEDIRKINLNKKIEWKNSKIKLKASKSKISGYKVERKRIRNKYSVIKRKLFLEKDKKFNETNNLNKIRAHSKNEIKYINKVKENELKDNLLYYPLEISNKMYWFSVFLGIIFPGIGSIFVKKYAKGIFQIFFTCIAILIIFWILGFFPSYMGNGIVGLGKLGYDPATSTSTIIGETNGVPNDGRFYLVMGSLAIIMSLLIIVYWIISALDNINQNNLAKLGVRQNNWKMQKKILKLQGLPYLLSLPAMIFIVFIVVLPLFATILISFSDFGQRNYDASTKRWIVANGVTGKISWVGSKQFKTIFVVMGSEFTSVFTWTIIWTLGSTSSLLIIGTFFAVIVNQKRIKFKGLIRVIYILPWAIPAFITILFFSIFLSHDGPFNKLFGIDTDWKQAGAKTKFMMIMLQGWLGHSYIFLLVTGMLQSIPVSLYEASKIDGASGLKQFKTITTPIILSKIAPLLIGQFVFNFNNFGLIYLFNEGGIVKSGKTAGEQDIFISWIYKLVSGTGSRPGAAAAMSLVISIFTITPSAFMFIRSKAFKGNY